MNNSIRIIIFLFILLVRNSAVAQNSEQLWFAKTIEKIAQDDTVGVGAEIELHLNNSSRNNAILFLDEMAATEYLVAADENVFAAKTLQKSNHLDSVLDIDSLKGILNCLNGFYFYYAKENYPVAIDYLNKAALNFNNNAQSVFQAKCFGVRALIFQSLNYPDDSEKDWLIALKYYHKNKFAKREAAVLNNIGIINTDRKDSARASQFLFRSLAIRDSLHDVGGVGQTYNNIGALMYSLKHYKTALDYFLKAYDYRVKGNVAENGIIESRINIGKAYYKIGDKKNALAYLEKAYDQTDDTTRLELRRRASFELMSIYFDMGDLKRAYQMQSKYFYAQDSLYSKYQKESVVRLNMQYEFENKQKQDSLLRAEKEIARNSVEQEKEKRTNIIFISLLGGLGFAGFFVFILYKSNLEKKKSNHIILSQRDVLNQKQQEITESIRYAQYIQEALLPDPKMIENIIADYFIFYQPKDIVSGDFYWFHKISMQAEISFEKKDSPSSGLISNAQFFIAVADCTGHGVPGAFMSLLGKENLDKVCLHSNQPKEILALLNRAVKKSLRQNNQKVSNSFSSTEIKDGMDIAIVRFEKNAEQSQIIYSGANRPLWIIRKNSDTIENIKATKSAIGGFTPDDQQFEETVIPLFEGDAAYLFTDGFADQFGGDKQKKMNTKKLRELLLSIHHLPMKDQKEKLKNYFREWKGGLEQVDDILIIGLRF